MAEHAKHEVGSPFLRRASAAQGVVASATREKDAVDQCPATDRAPATDGEPEVAVDLHANYDALDLDRGQYQVLKGRYSYPICHHDLVSVHE